MNLQVRMKHSCMWHLAIHNNLYVCWACNKVRKFSEEYWGTNTLLFICPQTYKYECETQNHTFFICCRSTSHERFAVEVLKWWHLLQPGLWSQVTVFGKLSMLNSWHYPQLMFYKNNWTCYKLPHLISDFRTIKRLLFFLRQDMCSRRRSEKNKTEFAFYPTCSVGNDPPPLPSSCSWLYTDLQHTGCFL